MLNMCSSQIVTVYIRSSAYQDQCSYPCGYTLVTYPGSIRRYPSPHSLATIMFPIFLSSLLPGFTPVLNLHCYQLHSPPTLHIYTPT